MAIVRHDSIIALWCSLIILPITAFFWYWGVLWVWKLPEHGAAKALWHAALYTPAQPKIMFALFVGLTLGFVLFLLLFTFFKTNFHGAYFSNRLRGPRMASQWMLRVWTFEGTKQLRIGNIRIPSESRNLHMQLIGSTGVGKSQGIGSIIDSAKDDSRIACIDPNGTFMSQFFKEGDYILNPFDARTQNWSIFNEIRNAADCQLYAVCVIPKSASSEQEQWNRMARVIVSEVLLRLSTQGKGTTADLIHWLATVTNDELASYLKNSIASGMFHGANETLGSVRTVLTAYIGPHQYMPELRRDEKPFSIRTWIEEGRGNLWVPWRQDMLESLRPLISCWTDVIAGATLSSLENRNTIFVVDELDSLEKLNYFLDLATKGRKHGVTLLAGIQSFAQLDSRYGKTDALTLRNNLRSIAAFGISEGDTFTSEQLSVGFGEHEVVRTVRQSGDGKSQDGQTKERIILPSEIHGLPNLTGYLKLPGDIPTTKFSLKYVKRPEIIEPFVKANTKWTVDIQDYDLFNQTV